MIPSGYVLYKYQRLDSTNAEALRLLKDNKIKGNTIIVASEQISGRGRNGKTWVSQPGNLYMTIILKKCVDIQVISQLSFITAIAVDLSLSSTINNITYKWPNDILVDNKKLCGILLESHNNNHIIIGIGININHAPEYATYIQKYHSVDTNQLISDIVNNFNYKKKQWITDGFSKTQQKWLSKAHNIGGEITVKLNQKTIKGIFHGIDESGRLILKTIDEIHYINSGSVFYHNI